MIKYKCPKCGAKEFCFQTSGTVVLGETLELPDDFDDDAEVLWEGFQCCECGQMFETIDELTKESEDTEND